MLDFDSIYFDSEPLVASQWPHISVPLRSVFIWSKHFNVRLFLPVATEMELEEHWYREVASMGSDITTAANRLSKTFGYVDMVIPPLNLPTEATTRPQYRAMVKLLKDKWGIESVPLTGRPVKEVFTMAIKQSPPFKEEGAGFQDTVIYMSVIDHLREHGGAAAYVSNDAIFKKQCERILQIADDAGVRLRLYRTLAELNADFQSELGEEIGRAMEHDRQLATDALNARLGQIEEFIIENVEIPKSHPFVGDLVEVQQIEVSRIDYVVTTYRRDGEPVNISFQATITAQVLLDPSSYAVFRQAFRTMTGHKGDKAAEDDAKVIRHRLEYQLDLEATGTVEDDRFVDIELASARIKNY
jgi:hypothetical protein